jgi:hypothetical protein
MKKKTINEVVMGAPLDRMPSKIKHGFGEKRSYEVHPGVDLATPSGTAVKAPMDGEVVNVNNNGPLCGGTIDIDYKNGFWSRFCHIKRIDVRKGQVVKAGQVVGLSGGDRDDPQRGNSKGAHLHFTLKKDGKLVDPMLYINKFDVGTSEFPMSAGTKSDGTNWDDFFNKDTSSLSSVKKPTLDPLLKKVLSPLEKALNLQSENRDFINRLNEDIELVGGEVKNKTTYSVNRGSQMVSPENGEVTLVADTKECTKSVLIKHVVNNQVFYSKFCNIRPRVTNRQDVSKGQVIGTATESATIQIIDKKQKPVGIKNFIKTKDDITYGKKPDDKKKIKSMDPLLKLALSPLKILDLPDMKSATDSTPTEPFKAVKWLKNNSITKNESVNKDINKIKKLL